MKPTLKLVGIDGNAFAIIGAAHNAFRKAGQEDKMEKFYEEAISGDYNHLLQVCMKYFEVK